MLESLESAGNSKKNARNSGECQKIYNKEETLQIARSSIKC